MELKHLLADPRLHADLKRLRDLSGNIAQQSADSSEPQSMLRIRKRHAKHLTGPQIDQLVVRYQAGATARILSDEFGIHHSTVLLHLKRRGVQTRAHVRKLTDAQVAEAAEWYRAGDSLAKIGKRLGVDTETARREFKKIGVEIRPVGFQARA